MPKIPTYTSADPLTGSELFVIEQGSATKKATSGQIRTYAEGSQGPQGEDGAQGAQGAQGADSTVPGPTGPAGITGPQGAQGDDSTVPGPQGTQGYQGNTGSAGTDPGPQGYQGAQGYQGYQGELGVGAQGVQGTQGAAGTDGYQGYQGVAGAQGTAGVDGFDGVQGAQGNQGYQGNQGNQGNQGYQGNVGLDSTVPGPQGDDGAQGNQGYQGEIGAPSTVAGPQGYQGYQGYQGNQGYQGTQGDQSAVPGPQGDQGNIGAASTVPGPQGFQGYQGYQGDVGVQGVAGGAMAWKGDWSGATAYVVDDAVESNGSTYICTAAHTNQIPPNISYWGLSAQVGAQGYQGYQGDQGDQGYQGIAGTIPGPQGNQGYQGYQGYQGVVGADSTVEGPQGVDGTPGAQGNQGYQGTPGGAMSWKGPWSGITAYVVDDAVENNGSTYLCRVNHTNQEPPNLTYWALSAQAGEQGAPGQDGVGDHTALTNIGTNTHAQIDTHITNHIDWTNAIEDLYTTGSITSTDEINTGFINSGSATSLLEIAGGGKTNGAYINMFGGSHASFPNEFWFVSGGAVKLDFGADTWDFKAMDVTTTGTLNCGPFISAGITDTAVTGTALHISDNVLEVGNAIDNFLLKRSVNDDRMIISGGDGSTSGGNLRLGGGTSSHAPFEFRSDSTIELIFEDSGTWLFAGNDIQTNTVKMIEKAAAGADTAGQGQLWVKTATPTELWFTRDDGTEIQLDVAGGGGTYDYSTTISGATVFDEIDVTDGVVTNISTREFSHADLASVVANEHIDWTTGTELGFDSMGIADNSTYGPQLTIADKIAYFGDAGTPLWFSFRSSVNNKGFLISGGISDSDGCNLVMAGGTYAVPGLFQIKNDATVELDFTPSASVWDFKTNSIMLGEKAAAEADIAGKGQLWVKTATPNQLWFTSDDGTDNQITPVTSPTWTEQNTSASINASGNYIANNLTTDITWTLPSGGGDLTPLLVVNSDLHSTTDNTVTIAGNGKTFRYANGGATSNLILYPGDYMWLTYYSGVGLWAAVGNYDAFPRTPVINHVTGANLAGTTRNVDIFAIPSYYVEITASSAVIRLEAPLTVTLPYKGMSDIRLSGKVFVKMNGSYSAPTVSWLNVANTVVKGTGPVTSGDYAIIVWEYFNDGTTEFGWAEWVNE